MSAREESKGKGGRRARLTWSELEVAFASDNVFCILWVIQMRIQNLLRQSQRRLMHRSHCFQLGRLLDIVQELIRLERGQRHTAAGRGGGAGAESASGERGAGRRRSGGERGRERSGEKTSGSEGESRAWPERRQGGALIEHRSAQSAWRTQAETAHLRHGGRRDGGGGRGRETTE